MKKSAFISVYPRPIFRGDAGIQRQVSSLSVDPIVQANFPLAMRVQFRQGRGLSGLSSVIILILLIKGTGATNNYPKQIWSSSKNCI